MHRKIMDTKHIFHIYSFVENDETLLINPNLPKKIITTHRIVLD